MVLTTFVGGRQWSRAFNLDDDLATLAKIEAVLALDNVEKFSEWLLKKDVLRFVGWFSTITRE